MNYNIIQLLLYILCTLQLQPYHKSMVSKPSPSTNTFIEEGQGTKSQVPHGNPDVATTSAHSYVVPKYVTDVATLIALKILKQSIAKIPFQELSKQVQDLSKNLEIRMCSLELTYKTLKDIILQRTKQQSQLDSSLLERWNPSETVLRYSPWTCMRLMLNLVAEDNITDLFPNDWQPVSPQSTTQQKHFQVLTEVMTELFLHCGLVNDEWVIEVTNYQDILKVLLHHLVVGNISTTQVTQFTILMVYMSICRLKHYSDAMENRHAMMLKSSIWMTLVIMAFRTTFTMMGGTKIISTYYRNIPATVRRHLHVAVIRYMEQDCMCPNHVQCDIVPFTLTSEVVLPSYQHYLER